jgi:aminopeptidase N
MKAMCLVVFALVFLALLSGCDYGEPARVGLPSPTRLAYTTPSTQTRADTPLPPEPAPGTTAPAPGPAPTATASLIPPPTSTPDVNTDFARAMRPAFVGDVAANDGLPRYNLWMWIATNEGVLTGTEQIVFPNRTGAPLNDVALRLYPNFPPDVFGKGGDVRMDVTGVAVEGQPVEIRYTAQRTAVLLSFPQPLNSNHSTTLAITFTATIQPWRDGTWPLPSYYPMLAVRDSEGWRMDVTRFADHVYAESAFYTAEITIPADLSIVTSGSTIATQTRNDGSTMHIVRTGPVREFALTVGDFVVARDVAGARADVAVNVYTARDTGLNVRQIARVAAAALTDFDRRFGPYPYRELDIHLLPYDYDGGDEYPGLILLYSDGQVDAGTRYVAAHEVAHQWWYGVVGNDIYKEPWLDEALAQYSGIIYDEDVVGASVAAADWEREVLQRYNGALADGDLPIGLGINGYPNFNVYYRTVYGKGSVFLRMLREELGDDAFFRALQVYYQRHRYGVTTTRDVQRTFEEASGRDLGAVFRRWVRGR